MTIIGNHMKFNVHNRKRGRKDRESFPSGNNTHCRRETKWRENRAIPWFGARFFSPTVEKWASRGVGVME